MKITVIGSGYVGLVTGACLSELGNHVFCLDLDEDKIALLNEGSVPIHEPGLEDLIARNVQAGRLIFSTDIKGAVEHGEIQFIAVGTPPADDGSADLSYVIQAAHNIGKYMAEYKVIVNKSTVPVGTGDVVSELINKELTLRKVDIPYAVISNPEFLKEGAAIDDFMKPDRIVIGRSNDHNGLKAEKLMKQLYAPFNRHHERTHYMDIKSAELTKYAANAMLATRISFMNELANLADIVGADIEMVRQGIGSDSRIGYSFLYAGVGYGGSCFPKDVKALIHTSKQVNLDLNVLKAVDMANNIQKEILFKKIDRHFDGNLVSKNIAIWGLAFKPNTDDVRDAPSRKLIHDLVHSGAGVTVYDPVANHEFEKALSIDFSDCPNLLQKIKFSTSMMDSLTGVDALAIVTEWKNFKSPDFIEIKKRMNEPIIFDGRNLYEPTALRALGFTYHGIGRGQLS